MEQLWAGPESACRALRGPCGTHLTPALLSNSLQLLGTVFQSLNALSVCSQLGSPCGIIHHPCDTASNSLRTAPDGSEAPGELLPVEWQKIFNIVFECATFSPLKGRVREMKGLNVMPGWEIPGSRACSEGEGKLSRGFRTNKDLGVFL